MQPRERVLAALKHRQPDRVPFFEVWIDALLPELGQSNLQAAHANLGQDAIMLPTQSIPESNAWKDGVDEFGRVWKNGIYFDGMIKTKADLRRFSPPLKEVDRYFNPAVIHDVLTRFQDHFFFYGVHNGPFTATYLGLGLQNFFRQVYEQPQFIHNVMEERTEWCIAFYKKAIEMGAELIILGDDAGFKSGPMISPRMWRELVLPYHSRIAKELNVPVIWHSDGDIRKLIPMAIEADFIGLHGLEPTAGIDLGWMKQEYGRDLVLIGNVDVNILCQANLDAVHKEVDRCINQGSAGGGYMLSTCNSIFSGMNPAAVMEFFRYEKETFLINRSP